jgi:hypothetical protein
MDTFMSEAIVLEAALISVLLALLLTSVALRGLFWLMTLLSRPFLGRAVQPIRVAADQLQVNRGRKAA